jgi:hypothetical protein
MLPGSGTAVVRAAIVVPVILLVLFAGVFGLLGLLCGRERRKYATNLSLRAMSTASLLIHGPAVTSPQRRQTSGASSGGRARSN